MKNVKPNKKKITIKWENVLLIPMLILAVSGIIKSHYSFIIISLIKELLIIVGFYYLIKLTRQTIQKKGLLRAVYEFLTLK